MELDVLRDRFVSPFYLKLLHANFTTHPDNDSDIFQKKLVEDAREISNSELQQLFDEKEWRGRLTAAWFVAISYRRKFVELIGSLLLKSELTYAGQGYCVAFGLIDDPKCIRFLKRYLRMYLPLDGRHFDQHWAIGALAHATGAEPEKFLDSALWRDSFGTIDPLAGISNFRNVVSYMYRSEMIVPGTKA